MLIHIRILVIGCVPFNLRCKELTFASEFCDLFLYHIRLITYLLSLLKMEVLLGFLCILHFLFYFLLFGIVIQ
jgi:hypothetical protein